MTDATDYKMVHWRSRGIGLDITPGCFVCGATWRDEEAKEFGNDYMHNIAAGVSVANMEAAMACFERGARMAFRHGDQRAPQIKVGACTEHKPALEHLSSQWGICKARVAELVTMARYRSQKAKEEAAPG